MKAYFNPKQMGEGKEETREVFGSLFNSVPPNGSYAAGDTATFGSKGEANASTGQCKSKVGQVPEGRFWNWLSDQYVLNCFSSPCDPVKITECHCLRHQNSFFFSIYVLIWALGNVLSTLKVPYHLGDAERNLKHVAWIGTASENCQSSLQIQRSEHLEWGLQNWTDLQSLKKISLANQKVQIDNRSPKCACGNMKTTQQKI